MHCGMIFSMRIKRTGRPIWFSNVALFIDHCLNWLCVVLSCKTKVLDLIQISSNINLSSFLFRGNTFHCQANLFQCFELFALTDNETHVDPISPSPLFMLQILSDRIQMLIFITIPWRFVNNNFEANKTRTCRWFDSLNPCPTTGRKRLNHCLIFATQITK